MSASEPILLTSWPARLDGPAPLSLQLEICRLRAELEAVEERLADARRASEDGLATPFADRTALLVDRMVGSMKQSIDDEASAVLRSAESEAAARVAEGARQAQMVVAIARADLAAALDARAEAVEAEHRRWRAAYRAWDQLHVDRGTTLSTEVARAADLLGIGPTPAAAPGEPSRPAPPAGRSASHSAPRTSVTLPPPPAALTLPPPPAPSMPPPPVPTPHPGAVAPAVPFPSPPAARPAATAPSSVPVDQPEETGAPGTQAEAIAAEAARTDAAFEAWMAVAPNRVADPVSVVEGEARDVPADVASEEPDALNGLDGGRRWVLPLEIAASLGAVALLVVALLIAIG